MVGESGGIAMHGKGYHDDRVRKIFSPAITGTGTLSVAGATVNIYLDTIGDYAVGLGYVPEDFVTAVALHCLGYAQDVGGATGDVDFYMDVQRVGALYDANQRNNLNVTWNLNNVKENNWKNTGIDVTSLVKGDVLGFSVLADTVNVFHIYGWIFEYNAEE